MQFFEKCRIKATGRQLYPLINAVRESRIICTEQFCKADSFFCIIRKSDISEFIALAEQLGIQTEVQEFPSLVGRIKRYKLRFGFVIGAVLSMLLIFYSSNIVTKIELTGLSEIPESEIRAVMDAAGIREGCYIGGMNLKYCERQIRLKNSDIAWVSIRRTGSRLVVHLYEATKPQTDMVYKRLPCDIISQYDAQITGVSVLDGKLCPGIGDGVAAGDVLISGVWADKNGLVTYHHAMGTITGIYQKPLELSAYFTEESVSETGRIRKLSALRLFHISIPLHLPAKRYAECRELKEYLPFRFLGKTLPFGIEHTVYLEMQSEIRTLTPEEVQERLQTQKFQYERNFLEGTEILNREIQEVSDENGITWQITYTLQGEIGMQRDLLYK